MSSETEPILAPPGAGLPKPELFIARLLFRLRRLTGNRASFLAKFQQERAAIHTLLQTCDEKTAATRVLIARIPGLEDSSRYWSVWMTLDHLRIVHLEMSRVIPALASGHPPEGAASTAAVKPDPNVTTSIATTYEQSCTDLLAIVAAIPDLHTRATYPHPWFGPLNAENWFAIAGTHLAIHRVQIERILAGLP